MVKKIIFRSVTLNARTEYTYIPNILYKALGNPKQGAFSALIPGDTVFPRLL